MSLLWHLVRKDLRRMAGPAACWLVGVVAATVWFRLASPGGNGDAPADVIGWLAVMRIWTPMVSGVLHVLAFLLAAALVLEDPLVGTDAFWITRPIGRLRMLAAKMVSLTLGFVLLPVGLVALVSHLAGVRGGPLVPALLDLAASFAFAAVAGLLLGALTRSLAQVVFAIAACIVGWFVSSLAVALLFDFSGVPGNQRSVGVALHPWMVMVVVTALLIHQYATRRHVRSRLLLAGCVPLLVLASMGLPLLPLGRGRDPGDAQSTSAARVTVEESRVAVQSPGRAPRYHLQVRLRLQVEPAQLANGLFPAPSGGWLDFHADTGDRVPVRLHASGGWGHGAAEQVLLGRPHDAFTYWQYGTGTRWLANAPSSGSLEGFVELWLGRVQVVGEFSPERGATMHSPNGWLRVIAVETPASWDRALVVEERDFDLISATSPALSPERDRERQRQWVDVYLRINRAENRAEALNPTEMGAVALNNQITHFRRIYLRSARENETWLRDAVLVKVRIQREGGLERAIQVPATPVKGLR